MPGDVRVSRVIIGRDAADELLAPVDDHIAAEQLDCVAGVLRRGQPLVGRRKHGNDGNPPVA